VQRRGAWKLRASCLGRIFRRAPFTVVYARRLSDLSWIERLLQAPPSCLSELEPLVGRLDVDFAGDEIGCAGPSPLYDVRACQNQVVSIEIQLART
jgi:hypothetical protein